MALISSLLAYMSTGFTLKQLNNTGVKSLIFVLAIYINHILKYQVFFIEKIKFKWEQRIPSSEGFL